MFKIAICDDNKMISEYVEKILGKSQKYININIEISTCTSRDRLYPMIQQDKTYDHLFIGNIEMESTDGAKIYWADK